MASLSLVWVMMVGVAAGMVNTLAGGGSLITLPALIHLGLPADVANGTNRVGILSSSLTATWRYREAGMYAAPLDPWVWGAACLGAVIGSWVSVELDEQLLRLVIGLAMLAMVGVVMVNPRAWLEERTARAPWWGRALGFLCIGFYGGFLQAGVGYFLLAGLVWLCGHDVVRANGLKVALVLAYTVPALGVFWWADAVRWEPGLALLLGSALGGWLGARLTMAWGPGVVRWVVVVSVLASSGRLLGLW